jgi:hypothetical protein
MNIGVVGDNRRNRNWGARAATIALMELLSKRHHIQETIGGEHFSLESARYGLLPALLPTRYAHWLMHVYANRTRRRLFAWYWGLERLFGAQDFVDSNPDKTAENIIRFRSRYAELASLYSIVASTQGLVVNGEGDMVFTTPPRREALFQLGVMALAQKLDKPTFFVNAMVSDCPITGRNQQTAELAGQVLTRCHLVCLRDPVSVTHARSISPEANVRLVPDSLFYWLQRVESLSGQMPSSGDFAIPYPEEPSLFGKLDFSRPYICVGGGAAAVRDPEQATKGYIELVSGLKQLGMPVYLTANDGRDSFLKSVADATGTSYIPSETPIVMAACILANASLFVSGRYHAAILASLGGTPCIFLASAAHKMESIQTLLQPLEQITYPAIPSADDVRQIRVLGERYLDKGHAYRGQIIAQVRKCYDQVVQLAELIKTHPNERLTEQSV